MSLKNKVAIVTGSSSGIGAAIAVKFSSEGAKVVLVGRNQTKLNAVAVKCNDPLVVRAELANDDDVKRILDETIQTFGKLDILVNNAGISLCGSLFTGDLMRSLDELFKINFRAIVYLTKLAAPYLIQTKGNIINISSISGQRVCPILGLMMYSSLKAALDHFSKHAALELSPHGVRLNVISPGPVKTDILKNTDKLENTNTHHISWDEFASTTALHRVSEPEEIAEFAFFLISENAKGITGSVVVHDNGKILKN
ncbi:uncharacterized oxidoreductase SERP2049-like [Leptidea sinapis]|uniref:3-oxoacyl-[acyl-carrier-protein] reductase n=1 Tax=Leptidea sinapis TaxID=189913 RepID=A0A5E4QHM4_9NEOP|nr:uncharacterized oxidoreductase SERP2049-like [Leptidea sinapis]VVC97042.1 unnamed protein product [Leptidea sinapis]